MTGTEGERGTALMLSLSAQMTVSDQRHAPAALFTENRQSTHFRGWTCLRTGLDEYGEKKMSYYHRGSSTPKCPARCGSLDRLGCMLWDT